MTMINVFNNKIFIIAFFGIATLVFLVTGYKMFLTQASFSGIFTATVSINPLALELEAPQRVAVGENFKLEALLENKGDVIIEDATLNIFLPSGISSNQKELKKIGILPAQKGKKTIWILEGEREGEYVISVFGKGILKDSANVVQVEKNIKIKVGEQGFLQGEIFSRVKNLLDFFSSLW